MDNERRHAKIQKRLTLIEFELASLPHAADFAKLNEKVARLEKLSGMKKPAINFNPFEVSKFSPKNEDNMRQITEHFNALYCDIMHRVQDNRERDMAIQKLEDACMWIHKSISRSNRDEHDR